MISAECVRKRMDELGSRRIPFLFAVNYELSEGFVMENPLQVKDIWWEIDGMTNAPATQPTTKGTFSGGIPSAGNATAECLQQHMPD